MSKMWGGISDCFFLKVIKSNLSHNYQFYSINSMTCFFIVEGFSSDKLSSCCDMVTYSDSFWYSTHNWGNFVKFMEESDNWKILEESWCEEEGVSAMLKDEEGQDENEYVYFNDDWMDLSEESSKMVLYEELFFFEWYEPLNSCKEVIIDMEEIIYVKDVENYMSLNFYFPDVNSMTSVSSSGGSFCKKYFSLDFESETSNFIYLFSFMYLFKEFKMFQPLLSKFNFLSSKKFSISYLKFSCLGFSHNMFVWGSKHMPFSYRSKMFLYKLKGK